MFTLDTESGFRDVVFITSSYGLGEMVVQGAVNPDEFYVHKPMLERGRPAIIRRSLGTKLQKMQFGDASRAGRSVRTLEVPEADRHRFSLADADVLELARAALAIEKHYGRPMDIEWAKDGADGRIYVLQARPETVKSRASAETEERFRLKGRGRVLASGRAIGHKIGAGAVRVVVGAAQMASVKKGDVLVTDMTDPNWEPVMKLAAAIVTNRGGRTCHAAIIARELGIPAVVGCGDATTALREAQAVTVSCAEGDTGNVYEGSLPFEVTTMQHGAMPELPVKIAMNVGNPQLAFNFAQLPNAGVGLARLEFVINNEIGVHPRACLEHPQLPAELRAKVEAAARGYADPKTFFREKLIEGVATIAAAFWPKPVIVRLSDFKSNEYRKLLGGERYEPEEENPMLGFRGAIALPGCELPRVLRAGMRSAAQGARRAGPDQRRADGAVRADGGRSEAGHRAAGAERPAPRRERAAHRDDVRAAVERAPRRGVPRALRRLFHRLQRPHPAHARAGPRLGPGGRGVRRTRCGGEGAAVDGDPGLPQAGQVRRHLRPGALGPPGLRALADGAGHRAACRSTRIRWSPPGWRWPSRPRRSGAQRLRSSFCLSRCHCLSRSAARLSCFSLPCASPTSSLMRPLL